MHRGIGSLVATIALVLTGCSSNEASGTSNGDAPTLRIATDGTSSAVALHLGIEQGFFEEEGLEIELSDPIGTPPNAVAALRSNELDIASIPVVPGINAQVQGAPIKTIAPTAGFPSDETVAQEFDTQGIFVQQGSGINGPEDFEGLRIAVPARHAVFEVFITEAMLEAGADPSKVEWIALEFSSQVESLKSGRIDVAGLPFPFSVTATNDGHELLWAPNLNFYGAGNTSVAWMASPELTEDEALVSRFQTALIRSNTYANENREEAVEIASEITGVDVEVIKSSPTFTYFPETLEHESILDVSERMSNMGFIESPLQNDDFFVPVD